MKIKDITLRRETLIDNGGGWHYIRREIEYADRVDIVVQWYHYNYSPLVSNPYTVVSDRMYRKLETGYQGL